MRILVLVLLFAFVNGPIIFAQTQISSGDLTGTVTDASGGAIPQARITANEPSRGITRGASTGSAGEYRLPILPPGTYRIRVEAKGFASPKHRRRANPRRRFRCSAGTHGSRTARYRDQHHGRSSGYRCRAHTTIEHHSNAANSKPADQPAKLSRLCAADTRRRRDQRYGRRNRLSRRPGASIRSQLRRQQRTGECHRSRWCRGICELWRCATHC